MPAGAFACVALLTACSGGASSQQNTDSDGGAGTPPPVTTAANRVPLITGVPPANAEAGQPYRFLPTASDPDGDSLTFSITNEPAWAEFDARTGDLTGTPTTENEGDFAGVNISVTDGKAWASLGEFSIRVYAPDAAWSPSTSPPAPSPAPESAPPPAPSPAPENAPPPASTSAHPPTIAGTPPTVVNAGDVYEFRVSASDPDGDTLAFDIANKPRWATFDPASGSLTGMPAAADVGSYTNIRISVSDGTLGAALPSFSIAVITPAKEVATLNWLPPTQNTDGSQLRDLAGYHVLYGTSPAKLDLKVQLKNPGLSSYVLDNLSPGSWYFAVTAYTSTGAESASSNIVTRTIH